MKKWVIAAIFYLVTVTFGYTIYDKFFKNDTEMTHATNMGGHDQDTMHHEEKAYESEVKTEVQYHNGLITLFIKDKSGNPVTKFEVNHEKILHLIVVDEHLNQYYHLHPKQLDDGKFQIQKQFSEGSYKAFIDIKPKNLTYAVKPVQFTIGKSSEVQNHDLKPDNKFSKEVDEKTVTLKMSSHEAGKPITLNFILDKTNLEPYLGAMGHVVILDEHATSYLHVHPEDEDQPLFATHFEKPGIYKIWAEFKQQGVVRVFPFVVKIN
jgi:hypothetical protein